MTLKLINQSDTTLLNHFIKLFDLYSVFNFQAKFHEKKLARHFLLQYVDR